MEEPSAKKKVKDSLILLSRSMPIDKITVKTLIAFAGISRATFYKYFVNLTRVWHEITHDILEEMSLFEHEPCLAIGSDYHRLTQLTDYIYQRRERIKMLLNEAGDPIFQIKWEQQMKEWIAKKMQIKHSYPQEKVDNMARFLSYALIHSMIEAIKLDNKNQILASLHAMEDILSSFSANRSLLEAISNG